MLTGFKSSIRSIVFSPDGNMLVSGSSDSTVKLWDLDQGWLVREYLGHGNWGVRTVAFSPIGDLIASGGSDKTIQLWNALDDDGSLNICFFDPDATPSEQEAITYTQTDEDGITRTYALPCGSELPAGAVCNCNCIPGKYRAPAPAPAPKATPAPEPAPVPEPSTFPEAVPAPAPPAEPTPPPSISQPGGVICTCDKICTCIPVYY